MLKVSPLIKLYKIVFDEFVVNYYMMGRTVKHAQPDMSDTLELLRKMMHEDDALVFKPGRTVPYEVPDAVSYGLHLFQTGKATDLGGDLTAPEPVRDMEDFDIE